MDLGSREDSSVMGHAQEAPTFEVGAPPVALDSAMVQPSSPGSSSKRKRQSSSWKRTNRAKFSIIMSDSSEVECSGCGSSSHVTIGSVNEQHIPVPVCTFPGCKAIFIDALHKVYLAHAPCGVLGLFYHRTCVHCFVWVASVKLTYTEKCTSLKGRWQNCINFKSKYSQASLLAWSPLLSNWDSAYPSYMILPHCLISFHSLCLLM